MEWKKAPNELVNYLAKHTAELNCDFRKMFGYPAYFVNGNLFTGIHGDSLFIRLSESEIKKFTEMNSEATPFEPVAGRFMKGYVVVPQSVYSNEKLFNEWLKKSFKYASSLPPKKPKAR
jgi:TfoX/Sxy family transcriptional regulator of competence genes